MAYATGIAQPRSPAAAVGSERRCLAGPPEASLTRRVAVAAVFVGPVVTPTFSGVHTAIGPLAIVIFPVLAAVLLGVG